jgi:hypothetical protein
MNNVLRIHSKVALREAGQPEAQQKWLSGLIESKDQKVIFIAKVTPSEQNLSMSPLYSETIDP